ncbi:MAG: DNA mismatch repair endonuclease MutL [Clostridia bacterium]|jgi:DNA mismatch repair protein MutL
MGNIIILDENTANKIAAGEVIERPASVIKELVENSIDAGSTKITVEIENGGISFMRVTDNGSGILKDDVALAFERHGTGKIRTAEDIHTIVTLGFRGEALPSIAAVSDTVLTTYNKADATGSVIRVQGGKIMEHGDAGCPVGTTVTVRNLFYNTPARYKFLRSDSTESRYIHDILTRIALARPDISFTYIESGKEMFRTPGDNNQKSVIFAVYGKEIADALLPVSYKDEYAKITGFVGKEHIAAGNRNRQSFFVNGRYVKSKIFTSALEQAYKTVLMKNRYPFAVLNLEINVELVDVNVHPAKTEVRFSDEQALFRTVYHAVNNALMSKTHGLDLGTSISEFIKKEAVRKPAPPVRQSEIVPKDHPKEKEFFEKLPEIPEPKQGKALFPVEEKKQKEEEDKSSEAFIPIQRKQDTLNREEKKEEQKFEPYKKEGVSDIPKTEEVPSLYKTEKTVQKNLPEKEEPKELTGIRTLVFGYKIAGTAFDTYIFVQQGDNLYIIDQHAAHEKILYERLMERIRAGDKAAGQILLKPLTLDLTDEDMNLIEEYKEELNAAGYLFEEFGAKTVILREIPYAAGNVPPKDLFIDAINILDKSKGMNRLALKEELIYDMACKAAVKANKELKEPEIKSLVSSLIKLENPDTCPHGRPVYIIVPKKEFEKMFKRIV